MKKILAIVLILTVIAAIGALTGCSKETDQAEKEEETEAENESQESVPEVGPLALSVFSVPVGSFDLTFEPIDLGYLKGAEDAYEFSGDFFGGRYYITDEKGKTVYVYALDGTAATLENTYQLEDGYEKVSVNKDGEVYLSPGIFETVILNEDGTVTKTGFKHDVEWSKKEDFGVTTWVNADPTVIKDGVESPWVFSNVSDAQNRVGKLSMVFDCAVADGHVIIGGTFVENGEEDYRIGIFDYDGNELSMTAADDSVGYTALNEIANVIISANVNDLYLHDTSCNPLGEIKDLKGIAGFDSKTVSTFRVQEFSVSDDGSVYMLVYASKPDQTNEALLYKVTGF